MKKAKVLISIATYKEAENIVKLLKKIRLFSKNIKILIINDKSNDNTFLFLKNLSDKNLIILERPSKLGLGTAHKLSMLYSIRYNYDFLITMDGDFSHDPKYIPRLLEKSGKNNFVIGSRFCQNGKSDYKGLRKVISKLGNIFAKKILNLKINEITTYYRVYSVNVLKKIPFNELNAQGYSLGVKIIWLMKKLNTKMIEIPIHFKDRNLGKSKIPKLQIFISFFDVLYLKFKDIFLDQKFYVKRNTTYNFKIKCKVCKKSFFSKIKKTYRCLVCNFKSSI